MKHKISSAIQMLGLALLATAPSWAHAHTGHGTTSLMAGLTHPLGADHLLAMLAVGVWSVSALPAHKAWQGPVTFMLALMMSALLGNQGLTVPFMEQAIALSVVVFGSMLVLSAQRRLKSPQWGLGLIAAAASLHGLAHGAETPDSGFAAYAIGFLLMTACLHFGGVAIGLAVRRMWAPHSKLALTGLGGAMATAGLYLLTQV
jgi:urease accessory protein